jgi:hypothetical protein
MAAQLGAHVARQFDEIDAGFEFVDLGGRQPHG